MIDRTQPAARRRACLPPLAAFTAVLTLALMGHVRDVPAPSAPLATPAAQLAELTQPAAEPTLKPDAVPFADALDPLLTTLGGKLSRWAFAAPEPATAPQETVAEAPAPAETAPPLTAMTVPLPVPRPPELRGNPVRRASRAPVQQQVALPAPAPQEDNRSFFEKLFGVESPPARSYVALESKPADLTPRPRLSPPIAPPQVGEGGTATYDISARIVTLPNGERLEAHSGLGEIMDDPRHVNVKMRGATPPGTYVLTEREQLFHGVRAIRLTPVGGSEAVYNRVGLLAHTFMLGPTGASNGCVSFRDYNRFLESYLRGEIRQLVVVPGAGGATPTVAGTPIHLARN
jgi:hypothetical protein